MIMRLIKQYESETNNRFLIGNTEHQTIDLYIQSIGISQGYYMRIDPLMQLLKRRYNK